MEEFIFITSEFRVVITVTISASKRCSVRLYLQLFVGGLMSYLRYLCSSCCVFYFKHVLFVLCLVCPILAVFLDCPFLIATLVFFYVYIALI